MSTNINPKHVEDEDINELYATHFQIAGSEQDVVIGLGTLDLSITEQGAATDPEINYHTKLRMSPETARQLYELLSSQFGDRQDEDRVPAGVQ